MGRPPAACPSRCSRSSPIVWSRCLISTSHLWPATSRVSARFSARSARATRRSTTPSSWRKASRICAVRVAARVQDLCQESAPQEKSRAQHPTRWPRTLQNTTAVPTAGPSCGTGRDQCPTTRSHNRSGAQTPRHREALGGGAGRGTDPYAVATRGRRQSSGLCRRVRRPSSAYAVLGG